MAVIFTAYFNCSRFWILVTTRLKLLTSCGFINYLIGEIIM